MRIQAIGFIGAYAGVVMVAYAGDLHKEVIAVTLVGALIVAAWRRPTPPARPAVTATKPRTFWQKNVGKNRDVTKRIPVTLTAAQWMAIQMIALQDDEQIGKLCSAALVKQANTIIQQGSQTLRGNNGGKQNNNKAPAFSGAPQGQGRPPQDDRRADGDY